MTHNLRADTLTSAVNIHLQREVSADVLVGFPSLAGRLLVHVQSPTQIVEPGSGFLRQVVLLAHFVADLALRRQMTTIKKTKKKNQKNNNRRVTQLLFCAEILP